MVVAVMWVPREGFGGGLESAVVAVEAVAGLGGSTCLTGAGTGLGLASWESRALGGAGISTAIFVVNLRFFEMMGSMSRVDCSNCRLFVRLVFAFGLKAVVMILGWW